MMITTIPVCGILPVQAEKHETGRMNQATELDLIRRMNMGDESALLELHSQYVNLVYSVAYRILGDPMAAEEVTQDTFMRLWKKGETYDKDKGRFTTWLLTVTRRLAIDALRQRRRREPQSGMLFMDEEPTLWENLLTSDGSTDLRRTLRSVLNELPSEQRDLIELVYFYGMSHTDIAETLTLPLGTVKTRIRLGMQKLRAAWSSDN
jgi:RNA polymerase sigma-70 factor, ECF subfamily